MRISVDRVPWLLRIDILIGGAAVACAVVLDAPIGLTISAVVFVASLWIMQRVSGVFDLRHFSLVAFWYLTYIVMIYIPAFFVVQEEPRAAGSAYLFAVSSVLITAPLGVFLVSAKLRFRRDELRRYYEGPILEERGSKRLMPIFLLMLIPALALAMQYLREVQTIPLLYMLRNPGEYFLLAELREDSFKLLNSPFAYPYYVLRVLGFPFLISLSLARLLQTKSASWLLVFLLSLGAGLFFAGAAVAKMPVAAIFLQIVFVVYIARRGRVGIRSGLVALILILAFPLLVVLSSQHDMGTSLGAALLAIGRRLVYVPAMVLYYYFELFPTDTPHLLGRSISVVALAMGEDVFNTSNYVYQYIYPTRLSSGLANACFIGNLHADFGAMGVIIGGVLAGGVMQFAQVLVIRQGKTCLTIAAFGFLFYGVWILNSTALPTVLLSNGLVFVFFLMAAVRWALRVCQTSTFVPAAVERTSDEP